MIERAPQAVPPVYKFKPPDGLSPLHRFVALPDETLLVLGARRTPPVMAPAANPNTNSTISVCTSVGFRLLKAEDYAEAAEHLKPDIVVGLGDVPFGRALGAKRMEKATDRTIEWMTDHVDSRKDVEDGAERTKLFAPLLPVSCANQQFYVDSLSQDFVGDLSGLAVYDCTTLEDLPSTLQPLPRIAFTEPSTPQQALQHIRLGLDLLTLPFIGAATDAGIAIVFTFPAPSFITQRHEPHPSSQPLGLDMWLPTHATDLEPLVPDCKCHTCTTHHKAYIQHLLVAKEMLGWVLLQIHNHHVLDVFFTGVRRSIADGMFEEDVERFGRVYEGQMPEKTGQGPRVRGYQFRSEGPGEGKRNKAAFTMLNEGREKVEERGVLEAEELVEEEK